jgi:hypothetical protein
MTETNFQVLDERTYRRLIDCLPDDELMRLVRGMNAVDRAVDARRRAA